MLLLILIHNYTFNVFKSMLEICYVFTCLECKGGHSKMLFNVKSLNLL